MQITSLTVGQEKGHICEGAPHSWQCDALPAACSVQGRVLPFTSMREDPSGLMLQSYTDETEIAA